MSRVNVDAQAFLDSRFGVLAREMGWGEPDFAIGKMARLWMECTLRETDRLTEDELSFAWVCDGSRAALAIISADLGEFVNTKRGTVEQKSVRIRGCEGRTDWLEKKRKAGRSGGKKSKRRGKAKADSAYPNSEAHPKQKSNTPAPAPAPDKDSQS